ncbi:MAG: hypothetical protein Q9197_002799 [Variospora fuerteventurae]
MNPALRQQLEDDLIQKMEDAFRPTTNMETLLPFFDSTFTTWAIVVGLSLLWHGLIEHIVPKPYLDEFFHVQQAELYLQGRFTEWHPKITTPPGLYVVSLAYLGFLSIIRIIDRVYIADLRRTNMLAAGLLPFHVWFVVYSILDSYERSQLSEIGFKYTWSMSELNHAILNICLFPPLFFFYGLYYTDVWSVLSVLTTIQFYQRKWKRLTIVAGIASFFFRQTNVFWVSIYLGGSEVMHYIKFAVSVVPASVAEFSQLYPLLKPYIGILCAFGFFVLWNEGVVLGDRENHVASIHLAQMLYIWPYFMFFSFPLLYSYILNAFIPQRYIPSPIRTGSTTHQLPRLTVAVPIMAIMLLVVRFNTIVHPFTLADNRHYMFYVFRLLFRHPSVKYLVVPIYFICAWAAITGLGGLPNVQTPKHPESRAIRRRAPEHPDSRTIRKKGDRDFDPRLPPPVFWHRGHNVSTAVLWLGATALSLVTAPLVEPRYFIMPWLIWRLHMPSPLPTGELAGKRWLKKSRSCPVRLQAIFYAKHDHRLWLEFAWFLFVNYKVCYVFLFEGFEWPQEKGKVQRFMW